MICKIDRIYKMLECIHNENIRIMNNLIPGIVPHSEDQWKLATGDKGEDKTSRADTDTAD